MSGILVDTSVWIDFLNGTATTSTAKLETAIISKVDVIICPIIEMEILQGIRLDKEHKEVKERLEPLLRAPITEPTFIMASDIYRKCKKSGYTIRKSNDCIIAAVAIENKLELLHSDRDFEAIAKFTTLLLF